MSDIVTPLLEWLNANPQWAGIATFIISAAESIAIIGTIVPGSITMTAIGTLAGAGIIPLWGTIIWAILGAIVGDGISYWLGHYFKDRLRLMWPFKSNPSILLTGESFVHKYGVMSVFMGRFVGPVRALVPLVAGMLGMKPLQFTIANIASAIGWAPAYMLPGILLGAASLELPPDIAIHVILVLFLITLFVVLCIWSIYKLLQLIHHQTQAIQSAIWQRMKRKRHLSFIPRLLKHYDNRQIHGQLTLAFYFLLLACAFVALGWYVKSIGAASITANQAVLHFFRGLRNTGLDDVMLILTILGQKQVLLPVVAIIAAWLFVIKRHRAALHVLALGILSVGAVFVFKNIIQSPRPWGVLQAPGTYSMPSGHATLTATIFLGLGFLFASSLNRKLRWLVYFPLFLLALAIGLSRLYLSAHWLTDIVSAWILSGCILLAIVISYRRYAEKNLPLRSFLLVFLLSLGVCFGSYYCYKFQQIQKSYLQLDWPTKTISLSNWWQGNQILPIYRTSLFGAPSQYINIAWIGDLQDIKNILLQQGWSKPPPRDVISTLHRISDIQSAQYLPMISPQYLDKTPALIVTRQANDGQNLQVLRLWNSNRKIKENGETLWVGVIGIVPRSYNWLFKSNAQNTQNDPLELFVDKPALQAWEWKVITIIPNAASKKMGPQKMLLIRPRHLQHRK